MSKSIIEIKKDKLIIKIQKQIDVLQGGNNFQNLQTFCDNSRENNKARLKTIENNVIIKKLWRKHFQLRANLELFFSLIIIIAAILLILIRVRIVSSPISRFYSPPPQ